MIYKTLALFAFLFCFQSMAMGQDVYRYDPNSTYIEAIVMREHKGLQEFLKCHLSEPAIVDTFKALDKYKRTSVHYAALIEDKEFIDLLKTAGLDMEQKDIFGYSANDYINKKHMICSKCNKI